MTQAERAVLLATAQAVRNILERNEETGYLALIRAVARLQGAAETPAKAVRQEDCLG